MKWWNNDTVSILRRFVKQRLNTINESLAEYDEKKELTKDTRKKLDAIRREKVCN